MKFKDIQQMTPDEVEKKSTEMKKELMKLKAQVATGTSPEKSGKIREIKRSLAKIETARKNKK